MLSDERPGEPNKKIRIGWTRGGKRSVKAQRVRGNAVTSDSDQSLTCPQGFLLLPPLVPRSPYFFFYSNSLPGDVHYIESVFLVLQDLTDLAKRGTALSISSVPHLKVGGTRNGPPTGYVMNLEPSGD